MAIIQDVPPETLYRILTLLGDGSELEEHLRDLCWTSLVHSAWRAPSQALLCAEVDLRDKQLASRFQAHVCKLWRRAPPAVRRLVVDDNQRFELIASRIVGLRSLVFEEPDRRLGQSLNQEAKLIVIGSSILTGLDTLILAGPFEFHLNTPVGEPLPLRRLLITSMNPPPVEDLSHLFGAAPALSELHLNWSRPPFASLRETQAFDPAILRLLTTHAHHFRSLHLSDPPAVTDTSESRCLELASLLKGCTNLQTLHISGLSIYYLEKLVTFVPSELQVLETSLLFAAYRPDLSPSPILAETLNLEPLDNLKRWRMEWEVRAPKEEGLVEWEEALSGRGIELRDRRRFFTD